jgi:Fe-S-cluster containining protein
MGRNVFALALHADYHCRNSGACCTAGWPVPIEDAEHRRVVEGIAGGRLTIPPGAAAASSGMIPQAGRDGDSQGSGPAPATFSYPDDLPFGAAAIIRIRPDGGCVFFDLSRGSLCAIHRDLGHGAMPVSCRQFPRVALSDSRGTFVSLSLYCPTAARLLFREDASLEAVADPPMCAGRALEGFDATDTFPPLLRPGVLFDLAAYDVWDRYLIRTCARDDLTPECVLATLARTAERIRAWTPECGPLLDFVERAISGSDAGKANEPPAIDDLSRLHDDIAATVPQGLARPVPPEYAAESDDRLVRPAWGTFARPIRRFLASHAFGAWIAYQGDGVRTEVHALVAALAVLRIEAIRHAARAGRILDEELLIEAIRSADMLLMHLASRERMAMRLGTIEGATSREFLALAGTC